MQCARQKKLFQLQFLVWYSLRAMNLIPILTCLISAPFAVIDTPDSILTNPPDRALYIGKRKRYATCTVARWSPDGSIISSIGLLRPTIYSYRFADGNAIPIAAFSNQDGLELTDPEKLTYSPDGNYLAVSSRGIGLHGISGDWSEKPVSKMKLHQFPEDQKLYDFKRK